MLLQKNINQLNYMNLNKIVMNMIADLTVKIYE